MSLSRLCNFVWLQLCFYVKFSTRELSWLSENQNRITFKISSIFSHKAALIHKLSHCAHCTQCAFLVHAHGFIYDAVRSWFREKKINFYKFFLHLNELNVNVLTMWFRIHAERVYIVKTFEENKIKCANFESNKATRRTIGRASRLINEIIVSRVRDLTRFQFSLASCVANLWLIIPNRKLSWAVCRINSW